MYVTDVDRRIVYWNEAAAQITGWSAEDMLGRHCFDSLLSHVDKDGHELCGHEFPAPCIALLLPGQQRCPSGVCSEKGRPADAGASDSCPDPQRGRGNRRRSGSLPRHCSGAPRLGRAKAIQAVSLEQDLPQDARIHFATHYIPHDVVGGDFYGIRQLNAEQYAFFLADVMGHGLTAALYTMHLSSLWDRYHRLVTSPEAFAVKIGNELSRIVKGGESFAAGVCGIVSVDRREVSFAGAGNPPALIIHASGEFEQIECSGLPFGIMEDAPYAETRLNCSPGDRLLFFSDGASRSTMPKTTFSALTA